MKMPFAKTVFLVNRAFVHCQKEEVRQNVERDELAFDPINNGFAPQILLKTTKMAGVTQTKAWFTFVFPDHCGQKDDLPTFYSRPFYFR